MVVTSSVKLYYKLLLHVKYKTLVTINNQYNGHHQSKIYTFKDFPFHELCHSNNVFYSCFFFIIFITSFHNNLRVSKQQRIYILIKIKRFSITLVFKLQTYCHSSILFYSCFIIIFIISFHNSLRAS